MMSTLVTQSTIMTSSPRSVLLLGATGLVGSECLKLLASDPAFERVVVLTRRPFQAPQTSRVECHQVNFDDPTSFASYLNVDAIICALGTTIKKAGSQDAFRKVDYEYPLMFAKLAREAGASHFLLVTSMGADAKTRNFYLRVKGELETAVSAPDYPSLSIFRPSLLLGSRNEFRLGELVSQKVLSVISFMMPRSVRPVKASQVASAIIERAKSGAAGSRIVTNAEMVRYCETPGP